MRPVTAYKILGVKSSATLRQIEKAYNDKMEENENNDSQQEKLYKTAKCALLSKKFDFGIGQSTSKSLGIKEEELNGKVKKGLKISNLENEPSFPEYLDEIKIKEEKGVELKYSPEEIECRKFQANPLIAAFIRTAKDKQKEVFESNLKKNKLANEKRRLKKTLRAEKIRFKRLFAEFEDLKKEYKILEAAKKEQEKEVKELEKELKNCKFENVLLQSEMKYHF